MAQAGVDSRRNCEDLIRAGRVTVDGEVVTDPATAVQADEHDVRLDGEKLMPPAFRYFLINKPKGVVCTNRDPAGRPRAIDMVPVPDLKLFTVGRLDENTEGLLLITNDGALAEHLAHPRYQVTRKYRVQVAGVPEPSTLAELRQGMHFSDGFFHFHRIKVLKRRGRSTFVELELQEGKNREIRRLFARVGHKVMNLQRVAFGPLRLGRMEPGDCRELRAGEISELYDFVSGAPTTHRKPKRQSGAAARKKQKAAAARRERSSQTGSRRGAARNETRTGTQRSPAKKKAPAKRKGKPAAKGKPKMKGKGKGRKKA
ncbi:MAG: hypothetical protein Fues2KO_01030 [Fuerstiella sp.]